MTEPTDAELDELRQANSGRLNFVTFSEFRTIARAVLAKWGSQPLRHDQSPTLFTVFAKCDEYEGEVPLAQYSATSEYGVLDRVMGDARNAGYTGHAKDRMTELGWRIVPVYATPKPVEREPLTPREMELIDGMIAVQLDHATRCDAIANRAMADKQKGWDMERVALLQKLKAAHGIKGGQHGTE